MNAPAPDSTQPPRVFLLIGLLTGLLLAWSPGDARAFGEPDSSGSPEQPDVRTSDDSLFDFGLPLSFRIRLDGTYTRNRYASEVLSSLLRTARFGPPLGTPLAVESQVALTHSVGIEGLEIGVAWGSRSRLSDLNGIDFGRQFVGAVIRFSH